MARGTSLFNAVKFKPSAGQEEISAFLGRDTVFEGKMTFEGVLRLEGKFDGEIFESGTLIVGENATVKGKVSVNRMVLKGLMEGDLRADARVEIHSTGKFYGTLMTANLVVSEGGVLDGQCKMKNGLDEEKEDDPVARKVDRLLSASNL
jgi:cytoskeletal protein CcmA (bactofilin family)